MTGHSKETHIKTRALQANNDPVYHHPLEKVAHLETLRQYIRGEILEVFAGQGNLTQYYQELGNVTPMTKENFGDSFNTIYLLRGQCSKYDVIDIDSYGYPDKFFPIVFELMKDTCLLVFTFPIVGVNALNGIMEQHFITFWRSDRPTVGDITGRITDMALREWILPSLISVQKIKRIWRYAFLCKRVKATEFCNVKNR